MCRDQGPRRSGDRSRLRGDRRIRSVADDVIEVPGTADFSRSSRSSRSSSGLLHRAGAGCDVDKPRNLAKSVTVE